MIEYFLDYNAIDFGNSLKDLVEYGMKSTFDGYKKEFTHFTSISLQSTSFQFFPSFSSPAFPHLPEFVLLMLLDRCFCHL